jgi:hypothetical protein
MADTTPVSDSYIDTTEEADALAAKRPNSAAWTGDGKAAALQEATRRIDALPIRGRKYDTTITAGVPDQLLEFPRVIDGVTLDYNSTAGEAIIPTAVKWACLEEAIAILAAGSGGLKDLQEHGVSSMSIGGKLSYTFVAGAGNQGLQSAAAKRYMRRFVGAELR